MRFNDYDTDIFYDEIFESSGKPRPQARELVRTIETLPNGELVRRQKMVESAIMNLGITFNVYGCSEGTEKTWPFDIIPRVVTCSEWNIIEEGLKQRLYALNLFIHDIYHDKKILKDGIIPPDLIYTAPSYREACEKMDPPENIWCHIAGIDLIRDKDGQFYVLEDNLRCPSGVSYVIENRKLTKQILPQLFSSYNVQPVEDYPFRLLDMLHYICNHNNPSPTAVVLTPGIYNSAYFEHSFLAKWMGLELVQGSDLIIKDNYVFMRTTKGYEKVDVIYRRIDDDFLDPHVFRSDSFLGVPGLMDVYRAGNVALANAPGTGIADDKAIYAFVPEIIRYYMNEEPIIPNVPTYICRDEKHLKYVLSHMDELVIKLTGGSGGYGMLVGPYSTVEERKEFTEKLKSNPRNFIAQPTISLSRVPVLVDDTFEGRHVDMRPFVIYGEDIYVLPGGLTRVALKKGSLVVNSSQGGGSKDTWIVDQPS